MSEHEHGHHHQHEHDSGHGHSHEHGGHHGGEDLAKAQAAEEEQAHFDEVLHAFLTYETDIVDALSRRERNLRRVPGLISLLPGGEEVQQKKFEALREAARKNQNFFNEIVKNSSNKGSLSRVPDPGAQVRNLGKVRSTLAQCAREWSEEGSEEREKSFAPLLSWLEKYLDAGPDGDKRVLVPGAGLGRLLTEIVGRGYSCEGNEFSYQMLVTSDYVMNVMHSSSPTHQLEIHPLRIPDASATEILERRKDNKATMSMCAGEFLLVYGKDEAKWDAVVTCFFIDTAPNILDYLQVIYRSLKPGGIWINGGPLLWHWQSSEPRATRDDTAGGRDPRYDSSIELSWEEVKGLATSVGFEFKEEAWQEVGYNTNATCMLRSVYRTVQSVAIKKA
ncbi:Carnosine N-methyltransferase [Hondaea fermentalgiana]|uniref:carnosine N-methyltransferase n=1 Tax=Hondaea fermentalgiana TaxID=2315210 RepID=A0A2R5G3Y3_9STRA|nr:Carnosine N-methyltransferase [Hondaea fermentalgiana]|eukprot:GBG25732.1 Carnosine N-methyltransferase [Hondaea fermentalgiana]